MPSKRGPDFADEPTEMNNLKQYSSLGSSADFTAGINVERHMYFYVQLHEDEQQRSQLSN